MKTSLCLMHTMRSMTIYQLTLDYISMLNFMKLFSLDIDNFLIIVG